MKKHLFSFLAFAFILSSAFSQDKSIDYSNTRDGESVEFCTQHKRKAEYLAAHPEAKELMEAEDLLLQSEENNNAKATILYVPVVYHVLHAGGVENISNEQIIDAFNILNRDFSLQNSDANNVVAAFQGLPANVDIQFRMATKAPDGTCFSGITRTNTQTTFDGSNGTTQVNAVRNGNDVYQGDWPGDMYLNIFIVADAGGAAGYTTTPNNFWTSNTMNNGIWILHNYVGSIGTGSAFASRALTHEVGHWLNLEHTWGPNNNPGNAASCGDDDGVADTPNTIGVTSCNLGENSCGPLANVENYMDYSYCSKMFTPGQVTRMRTALQSSIGGRSNVMSASNLTATGADGNLYLCKAQFSADRTSVCAGEQITFTDESYNNVSGWTWTFTGGTPASSTSQNPVVTYNTPGLYEVQLSATDGSNNDVEIKTNYIRVLPNGVTIPYFEGFESYSTLDNITEWEIVNNDGIGFELANTGLNSSQSAKIMNYTQAPGPKDELISAPIDLTSITNAMTLSFRYAYKRKFDIDDDWLKVFVSNDCGQGWALRKSIHGQILSSDIVTSSFVPTDADWVTVHMTNITSSYWVPNFRFKFEFEAGGGNNMYIDNINIYEGAPSDEIVVSIDENEFIQDIILFPNPTDEELNIKFALSSSQKVIIQIQDVTGKVLQNNLVNANEGDNLVFINTSDLSAGVYFMKLNTNGVQKTIQFIIK